jgi:fucose permease
MIITTFWQVIANKKLLVPDPLLPLFSALRSVVAIVFLFLVVPHLTKSALKLPLLVGFAAYFAGQSILALAPAEGPFKYPMLCVSLVFDGFGAGSLGMRSGSLVALNVNQAERARVMAIINMIIMAATSPFGWIGGLLSDISRTFPFVLNLCLLAGGFLVTNIYYHEEHPSG